MRLIERCRFSGSNIIVSQGDSSSDLFYRKILLNERHKEDYGMLSLKYEQELFVAENVIVEIIEGNDVVTIGSNGLKKSKEVPVKYWDSKGIIEIEGNIPEIHFSRIYLLSQGGIKYRLGNDGTIKKGMQWYVKKEAGYRLCADKYCNLSIKFIIQ